jgi:ubiquinone/menaquinone biosynthesis C-methylase UbiE
MTPISLPVAAAADLAAVKANQRATWSSGNYAVIGTTLQIVGETLAEAADVRAGERVLDVAAGNGNASLAAARRFAEVTSSDYVPALLEQGRRRAEAEGLPITFAEADAEALPFADASFDLALSSFGVMFTPDHHRAAAELLRVVRPGGRIALACWTPEGFLGDLFRTIGRHVSPLAGVASPMLWGTEAHLRELFGAEITELGGQRRTFAFRYRSPAHWLELFRRFYGPIHRAFASLDAGGQAALEADLLALLAQRNTAGAGALVVPGEYLEVVLRRR